jgi:hypothetical protein
MLLVQKGSSPYKLYMSRNEGCSWKTFYSRSWSNPALITLSNPMVRTFNGQLLSITNQNISPTKKKSSKYNISVLVWSYNPFHLLLFFTKFWARKTNHRQLVEWLDVSSFVWNGVLKTKIQTPLFFFNIHVILIKNRRISILLLFNFLSLSI